MSTGTTKKMKLSTERNKALAAIQKARKLQEADDFGFVECISCGECVHISKADGGHFIPRQYRVTELIATNVNPQCRVCNRFDYGNQIGYKDGLIAKFGLEEEQRLENLFKAVKGNEEAYESLSEDDKVLINSKKTAAYYHAEYLKWHKVCEQLKYKECM